MLKILNITNGDYFNEYFLKNFGGEAVPFCEAMMDGETASDIYSEEFVELRARMLGVSQEEYRSKMHVQAACMNNYSELRLWFGKDTFCQTNLLTLLAYLEAIGYTGSVTLNYIDDETFEIQNGNVPVTLGCYRKLYESILITRQTSKNLGVLMPEAFELYFDYHSSEGKLARLVRDNFDMDEMTLICLLLENSKAYGLSDLQAKKLIKKYRI